MQKYDLIPYSQRRGNATEYCKIGKDNAAFLKNIMVEISRSLSTADGKMILEFLNGYCVAVSEDREYDFLITSNEVLATKEANDRQIGNTLTAHWGLPNGYQLKYDPKTCKSLFRPMIQEERTKKYFYRLNELETPIVCRADRPEAVDRLLGKLFRAGVAIQEKFDRCMDVADSVRDFKRKVDDIESFCKVFHVREGCVGVCDVNIIDGMLAFPSRLPKDLVTMDQAYNWLIRHTVDDRKIMLCRVSLREPLYFLKGQWRECYRSSKEYFLRP